MVPSLDPQGPVAVEMARLWWLMVALGGAVLVLYTALLLRGLWRGEAGRASTRSWLVGGGLVMPLVVIAVVLSFTLAAMARLANEPSEGELIIEVDGHQFWWEVRYPDLGVTTANEIHLPADRPILLRVRSVDVIHSFWIPSLAGKIDLLPDKTNTMSFSASETGTYRGVCAEFCGLQHAKMRLTASVTSEQDFGDWASLQAEPATEPTAEAAARGQEIFLSAECPDCHTIRGTAADGHTGPELTHLASRSTLAAGTIPNSTEHLTRWVRDPQEIKEGVEMEAAELSEEDLADLISYLESLQ
ncbi:MAG: cytochrome c oxidase subunit II [Acidimicrobiia bacterium]